MATTALHYTTLIRFKGIMYIYIHTICICVRGCFIVMAEGGAERKKKLHSCKSQWLLLDAWGFLQLYIYTTTHGPGLHNYICTYVCMYMNILNICFCFFYSSNIHECHLAWTLETAIHTFHTLGSRYLCQLTPLLLLRCILMRSVPDSQWKVFSSSQELREWMLVCGAVLERKMKNDYHY